jgi:EAL and modified HD-GYP domain-containing signal transduction protein
VEIFIAKQPIFDQQQRVFAYELFFRSGLENYFNHPDLNEASARTIVESSLLYGLENLTGGKMAFFNVTREVLLRGYVEALPKELAAVEIMETVDIDGEVMAAVKKLKTAGYLISLDDFVLEDRLLPLVELADIIKVDVLLSSPEQQAALISRFAPRGIKFVAEKVETQEAFEAARALGYSHFQGYFFCRPTIVSAKEAPGYKLHYFRLLRELQQQDLDFNKIEQILKRDVSLSFKLLRYLNSAYFGLKRNIDSIKQALNLLGETKVKKWAALLALSGMGQDKPAELLLQAAARARFCESLAPGTDLHHRSDDLFLMGMFSLIDAFLDRQLPDILVEMPLIEDIKGALLGEENLLHDAYEAALAYEQGQWSKLTEAASKLGVDESALPLLYLESVIWAKRSFQDTGF